MIAIVDYDAGNIRSVLNALRRVGASDYVLTASREMLRAASHVILPGVGDASVAMQSLRDKGLAEFIPTLTQPVLGICVGAQLMCESSEEGGACCMGIFPTKVRKFAPAPGLKIPHMGWNSLILSSRAQSRDLPFPLLAGLEQGAYVYFVHSYYPEVCSQTIATSNHGIDFSAALAKGNFFACQFHPEKSGAAGEQILKNFLVL